MLSELHDPDNSALAQRRNRFGPLQRLWAFSKAAQECSPDKLEDRCNQKPQSCQDCPGAEKEGECFHWRAIFTLVSYIVQSLFEANGEVKLRSEAGTPPPGLEVDRYGSIKASSGASDRSCTPVSRTATPAVNYPSNIAPQHLFDGIASSEQPYQHPVSIPSLNKRQPSSGSNSSLNERNAEHSPKSDELRQARTRISELEVVNDLFKEHIDQLEGATHQAEVRQRESDTHFRCFYEESQARENGLKHEIEDLKREIESLKCENGALKNTQPHTKRQRLSDDSPNAVRSQNPIA